jgi:hypothetical protein
MQRKKIRDQSVFGTKQWGGKRQIIFPINRWLSQTRKMRRGPKFFKKIVPTFSFKMHKHKKTLAPLYQNLAVI